MIGTLFKVVVGLLLLGVGMVLVMIIIAGFNWGVYMIKSWRKDFLEDLEGRK